MNKQEALKQIEEQRDMILDLHGWGCIWLYQRNY